MTIPRITEPQKRAIKNLMFSTRNIDLVLTYMTGHGKKYIGELSIGEARDMISALVGDSRRGD
jgi:replicative superfamily II helicase